jgi:hypothetical protein
VSHLLLPQDERELTEFLCVEVGAKLLLTDVTRAGEPTVAADPLGALPSHLPVAAIPGVRQIIELLFWLPDCGPVAAMCDAPEPRGAHSRVARLLSREAADVEGIAYENLIDLERTPVLSLIRTHWHTPARLAPGQLTSMPIPKASLPECVRVAYSRAERWLKGRGQKLDPFDHCPQVKERRPRRLGPLGVWAQPHALAQVRSGIEVWPWNR